MSDNSSRLRAEMDAALATCVRETVEEWIRNREPRDSVQHPDLDELMAYRQGRIEDSETDRLQEHLLRCRECLDRLSELEGFIEAGEQGPPEVVSLEEASAWRALRLRLRRPGRTVPLALAATFLLAAMGLGLWAIQQRTETTRLREQLVRISRPQPATRIVDLYSGSRVRGSTDEPSPVDLSTLDHLTVILHLPEPPEVEAFEAEILDSAGRALWRGRVRMDELGTLALGIPRPFLDAGRYRIVLYGVTGESQRRVGTFPLDLVSGAR